MYVCMYVCMYMDFPGGSVVKNLQYRRPGFDPWVGKIPWGRAWQPTPVLLPGEFLGQRSLVGRSPQGQTESDMTAADKQQRHHFQMLSIFTDWDIGSQGLSVWIRSQRN